MTRRRWIADRTEGDRALLLGEHAAHLARVLRARVGQQFDIAAEGRLRRGTVTAVSEERVEFALAEDIPAAELPQITLLLAVIKFDRMEWAVEKATELGAARMVPVAAQRSEARLVTAAEKRCERWQRIAREATEQSRRVQPPEITRPQKLKEALETRAAVRLVLSEVEARARLSEVVREASADASFALAVGPEGGWTEDELSQFRAAGWQAVTLGGTILRAETAAMAGLAVILAERG